MWWWLTCKELMEIKDTEFCLRGQVRLYWWKVACRTLAHSTTGRLRKTAVSSTVMKRKWQWPQNLKPEMNPVVRILIRGNFVGGKILNLVMFRSREEAKWRRDCPSTEWSSESRSNEFFYQRSIYLEMDKNFNSFIFSVESLGTYELNVCSRYLLLNPHQQ